jgi:hypothetical protein
MIANRVAGNIFAGTGDVQRLFEGSAKQLILKVEQWMLISMLLLFFCTGSF